MRTDMIGRFEGMSDAEWELVEDIFPDKTKKICGMPAAHPRKVLNSLLSWLPLVRSSARRARVLAEDLAFRRKGQGIARSCAE